MPSAKRVGTAVAPGSPDVTDVWGAKGGGIVPCRAEGLELLGDMRGSGYKRPPALVRRRDGQTITLTPLLYLLLQAADGTRTAERIATALSSALGRDLSAADVEFLLEEKLRPLGVLAGEDGSQPTHMKANPLLALRLKVVITNPVLTRRITAPFAVLFNRVVWVPVVAVFALTTWWLYFEKGLASAIRDTFYDPKMVLVVWGLVLVSAGFHEFGHAAACKYGGAQPGAMGAGIYMIWPAFYTDVTETYRLGRVGRLRVDLGGLYFNAIFALITLAAWRYFDQDALLLVVGAQHLQMGKQLAPFIRADGYHVIADITGVPDLFAHIKPTLTSILPRRLRKSTPPALKPWARTVVVLWVLLVIPLLLFPMGGAFLLFPRIAGTAWDSMQMQWHAAEHYWVEGNPAGVIVRLLASLIVALPVLGLLYLFWRLGVKSFVRAWRATRGKRLRRTGLVAVTLGVIAAVVWFWWPRGDTYRPIEGDDQIDIPMFVPSEQPVTPTAVQPPPTAYPVAMTSVQVLPMSSWVPLYAQPAPSVLPLVRALQQLPGQTAPTDVGLPTTDAAPNAPAGPLPQRQGRNRAWAINRTDGTVVTKLAVAWAITTAEEITNRNEAFALASCTDCASRAVAFQVLLLVGEPTVIAPVNVAAAVNQECHTCLTEALAEQLVVTVTGMPSHQAREQIGLAMRRVKQLHKQVEHLTMGQILYVLQATEAQIMGILDRDGKLPDMLYDDPSTPSGGTQPDGTGPPGEPDQSATATPSPSDSSSSPVVTPTSSPGASDTSTPTPSDTLSATPSESTSTTSTASPTGSASPTPTDSTTPSPTGSTSPSPSASTSSTPTGTVSGSATP